MFEATLIIVMDLIKGALQDNFIFQEILNSNNHFKKQVILFMSFDDNCKRLLKLPENILWGTLK